MLCRKINLTVKNKQAAMPDSCRELSTYPFNFINFVHNHISLLVTELLITIHFTGLSTDSSFEQIVVSVMV